MRALVTGGAGFIGSTLVDRLLAEGHSVDVIDSLSSGKLSNLAEARSNRDHDLTFHQIDIRNAEVVTLIERRALGGSAVLTDVVPSKTLIATAEVMTTLRGARASVEAIRALQKSGYGVKSLQEFHA